MKLTERSILFFLIWVCSSSFNVLFSQDTAPKATRQSSMDAFSKGNYEKAYSEFRELLVTYPQDPLYKYYSGVCLVKLKRNPSEAESLLTQAVRNTYAVKTLPADGLFYLGRAQQLGGKFTEAIASYNQYTELAGKKTAKEQNVADFIKQCNNKEGMAPDPDNKMEVKKAAGDTAHIAKEEPGKILAVSQVNQGNKKSETKVPEGFEKILDEALAFQSKADSLGKLAAIQKKQLEKAAPADKSSLKAGISANEAAAASYQKAADQKYSEAQAAMNPGKGVPVIAPAAVPAKKDASADTLKKPVVSKTEEKKEVSGDQTAKTPDKQAGTTVIPVASISKPVEIYSVFEVLAKPVTDPKEKISIDPVVPQGLVYRIQIAVFRNPVSPAYFKGITPVYGFKLAGTDKTNYYAGMFRKSADASKALSAVKAKGFKDAFVVAFSGSKSVSADRAAVLEKEWGKKPFMIQVSTISGTNSDTIPPALEFRVEVKRAVKPLKSDEIQGIVKMAGPRGLDIQQLEDGKIAYLIGKFITFESAAEYADLLIRNGYRETRVVAWLGKKEIPVDTARELFDNLK